MGGILFGSQNAGVTLINELPPVVTPSNPRELLYPTLELSKNLYTEKTESFAASYPMLQDVAKYNASVSWALNTPSTGWDEGKLISI